MSSSQKQPHVLVISYPAQGHVNPMLQFCKRLVAKGIKTTSATTLSFSKSVTFDKNNHLINLETFSDGFDDNGPDEIVAPEVFFPKLREVGPKSLSDLVLQLDRPNVIIYDGFFAMGP
ncbi:hypothetical protein Hdeb2414_s0010g00340921 [Helianthus debilis subsp. tardiflorus]